MACLSFLLEMCCMHDYITLNSYAVNGGQLEIYIYRNETSKLKYLHTAIFLDSIEKVATFWNRYSSESLYSWGSSYPAI